MDHRLDERQSQTGSPMSECLHGPISAALVPRTAEPRQALERLEAPLAATSQAVPAGLGWHFGHECDDRFMNDSPPDRSPAPRTRLALLAVSAQRPVEVALTRR